MATEVVQDERAWEGFAQRLNHLAADFDADAFGIDTPPPAYAWFILDAIEGQQILFAREDRVDEAWRIVDPVVARLGRAGPDEVHGYAAGSWGPAAAAAFLERDGRRWLHPSESLPAVAGIEPQQD